MWYHMYIVFLVFTQFCRLGEAFTPGPPASEFMIGTCNPSGISNKFEVITTLPCGIWNVAETQASSEQLASFRRFVKSTGRLQSHNRWVTSGAPAPLRAGSSTSGAWTGVLQLSSYPSRSVSIPWPSSQFQSGRVLVSTFHVGAARVTGAVVYGFPTGPTYSNPRALTNSLLQPITHEVVCGLQGPRYIAGDFNCIPGAVEEMELWVSRGWKEVQQLAWDVWKQPIQPTSKNSTQSDHIWISPELQACIHSVSVSDLAFPDHATVQAVFQVSQPDMVQNHWPTPAHLNWDEIDIDVWQASVDRYHRPFQWHGPSSSEYADWCKLYETSLDPFHASGLGMPAACKGRGQTISPRRRQLQLSVPKVSRPGEEPVASGLLGRSVLLWYKQLRRIQSLCHAVAADKQSPQAVLYRNQLWHSILAAKGFRTSFSCWWATRSVQLEHAPHMLPQSVPCCVGIKLIFEDFKANYRRYESWQLRQRAQALNAKRRADAASRFQVIKHSHKEPLTSIVDVHSQHIRTIEGHADLVAVDDDFPEEGLLGWQVDSTEAAVARVGPGVYRVRADIALQSGAVLTCSQLQADVAQIHKRLEELWVERWQKHKDVPAEAWQRIVAFARAYLPSASLQLPAISYEMWIGAVKRFKGKAARGPDAWSRADLIRMPRPLVEDVLHLFQCIERTGQWPTQLLTGLVHSLEKHCEARTVDQYRPITVFSMLYRCWAGIRASQLLRFFSQLADATQCGFLQDRETSDI